MLNAPFLALALAATPADEPALLPAAHSAVSDERVRVAPTSLAGDAFPRQAGALSEGLAALGVTLRVTDALAPDAIVLARDGALPAGAYRITTRGDAIAVRAGDGQGAAHACAALLQLVDVTGAAATWPALRIEDAPDLPFRAFMVDMGRNPHSPETLRSVVDVLWLLRVNVLQLHLFDDQMVSWPSQRFPRITSERAGWTREDFVELERYAVARGVTVVPELEVPAHSTILRREYPEVFGETPADLATSPEARAGIETLLDELLAVFRSTPYVHIGADEAYGVPEQAQRDLVNDLNAYLRARGRTTLVWEGPPPGEGDGAVDADVVHMCWNSRSFPAQAMLEAGHPVINAAWDPLYIVDHYPRTMFTAVDLERCYGFDPRRWSHVDPGFPNFEAPDRTSTADGILGFCMPYWEGREENLHRLCVPRLAAVGAAAWNRAGEDDLAGFLERYRALLPRLQRIARFELAPLPRASDADEVGNAAFGARVIVSDAAHQPPFGPGRLTNGITDRFDHFLGYRTAPEPLEIVLELREPAEVGRIVVHERAVGSSHEVYRVFVAAEGGEWEQVGEAREGSRGDASSVEHGFEPRAIARIRVVTDGCHGLTFPSFSRLTEIEAFAR